MKAIKPEHYARAFVLVMSEISGQPDAGGSIERLRAELAQTGAADRTQMIESMRKLFYEVEALPADRLQKIDALLADQGLPRLATFAGGYQREYQAILSSVLDRGRIVTDEECSAIEDEVDDMMSDLTDHQRVRLSEMIKRFYEE